MVVSVITTKMLECRRHKFIIQPTSRYGQTGTKNTNLLEAGFELGSPGTQAGWLPIEPPLLVDS